MVLVVCCQGLANWFACSIDTLLTSFRFYSPGCGSALAIWLMVEFAWWSCVPVSASLPPWNVAGLSFCSMRGSQATWQVYSAQRFSRVSSAMGSSGSFSVSQSDFEKSDLHDLADGSHMLGIGFGRDRDICRWQPGLEVFAGESRGIRS